MEEITNLININTIGLIGAIRRRAAARHRIEKPLKLDVINLFTDIEFYERFRMNKLSMRRLISIVEPKLK